MSRIDIDSIIPDESIIPITIPSYKRPKARLLKTLSSAKYPGRVVVFVRKEEFKSYRATWGDKFEFVALKGVQNIGETRAAIVDWCVENRIPQIFMMDDDINELDFLYPYETKNGTICMRAARQNMGKSYKGITPYVLRMWMELIGTSDKRLTISAPAYRPDSWHMKNANAPITYNSGACSQCIHLDIRNLHRKEINYVSTAENGVEDYALQFKVMTAGLLTTVFTDLMYNCPAINSHPGGCENANGYSDSNERYRMYAERFIQNVCGENHPGIVIKTARSGVPSIKFNWKYWRKENV